MSAETVCRVCLVDNMNLYCVRNDLQNVYERITKEKYNKIGYPVHMCYICLSMLQKCNRFMETARDTNNVLKQWYNQQNEMRLARPLFTYSMSKVDVVSTYNGNISLQHEIKVEEVDLGVDEVQLDDLEYNTDVDIEKTDFDEQTVCSELLVDNDNTHTDTTDYINDGQTDPLYDNKIDFEESRSLALKSDDQTQTNIETRMKIIYDSDEPPIKKLKIMKTKSQQQASKSSGETAAHSVSRKDHVCDLCNSKFASSKSLKRHKANIHTMVSVSKYFCKMCDYETVIQNNLVRHIRSHTGEKPFSCNICDYKCTRKDHLKMHMKTHTVDKSDNNSFSCNICDYKCSRKHHLDEHIRIHTGEKPFSCVLCDHTFTKKGNLVSHMKNHMGKKPFSCVICDHKCAKSSNLKQHMRIHTGEKPFSCDICDYKSSQKSYIAIHMRTHTGGKTYWKKKHIGEKPML